MQMGARFGRLRYFLIGISTLVASSIIAVALFEGMVRMFFPAYDPSGQVALVVGPNGLVLGPSNHTTRQSKNTGDYDVKVHFNQHGFRETKDVANARSGDIVVVGDSFAFGWGVEESQRFSNVLQTLLHRRVFNSASPGGNFELYDSLLKYAESLGGKIDDVVLAVCMENDLFLYSPSGPSASNPGQNAATPRAIQRSRLISAIPYAKMWLTYNSAAYRMLTTAVHQSPWLKDLAVRANLVVPNLVGMAKNTYSREVIEHSANRLARIARHYKHAEILIIPSRGLWAGSNRSVEDRVHREFIAALAARHLEVIDVRKIFESGGDPLSNHFRNDGHWNQRGHRLAAEALVTAFSQ